MDLTNQMPIATKSSKFDISKESDTAKIAKKVSKKVKKGDILFFLNFFFRNIKLATFSSDRHLVCKVHQVLRLYNLLDLWTFWLI